MSDDLRLPPDGLTWEQDQAFSALAEAIAEHMTQPCDGCVFHDKADA